MKTGWETQNITNWKCLGRAFVAGVFLSFGLFSGYDIFLRGLGFVLGIAVFADTIIDERYGLHVASAGIGFALGIIAEAVLTAGRADLWFMSVMSLLMVIIVARKGHRVWKQRRI